MTLPQSRSRIFIILLWGLFIIPALTSVGHSTDRFSVQARKKFKLHAVGLAFQTVNEMSSERPIDHPNYKAPGLIVNDTVFYRPLLTPPLTLPISRFSWIGEDAESEAGVYVNYTQAGDRAIVLRVLDRNSNTEKFVGVAARARAVGTFTEPEFCLDGGLLVRVFCAVAQVDSSLALAWAHSFDTGVALQRAGPDTGPDGKANSALHAYWNVLLTRDGGPALAEGLANAHEKFSERLIWNGKFFELAYSGIDAGDAHNSSAMDLINNARGREIADNLTFETLTSMDDYAGQLAVIAAANAGTLVKLESSEAGRGRLLEPSNK